jgi:hypothetical protein
MAKEKYLAKFANMDVAEMKELLHAKKLEICNVSVISNLEEIVEDIEALEFLIQNAECNG